MKKSRPIIVVLLLSAIFSFSSCVVNSYFQVYDTVALTKGVEKKGSVLVYEDENCSVVYDFWIDNGNAGFSIINKTGKNIYVDKGESFFVKNGMADNYYGRKVYSMKATEDLLFMPKKSAEDYAMEELVKNEAFLMAAGSVVVDAATAAAGGNVVEKDPISVKEEKSLTVHVSWEEEKVVVVPPYAGKRIADHLIHPSLLRYCGIPINPRTKKQVKPVSFTAQESPIVFENIISYKVGDDGETKNIRNVFYVSQIANYPYAEFVGSSSENPCGGAPLATPTKYFKMKSPDRFFVKYSY